MCLKFREFYRAIRVSYWDNISTTATTTSTNTITTSTTTTIITTITINILFTTTITEERDTSLGFSLETQTPDSLVRVFRDKT